MADPASNETGSNGAAGPPPPPPMVTSVPAKRLPSEIPERSNEPPLCVQNAMLTKDKKPFTYTPGGIDLSQIRSPRMARRIVRNAQSEGVTETPKPSPLAAHSSEPLPPSALAAMQPQMPIQVFPSNPPAPRPKAPSKAPPPPPILMRPSRLQKQQSPGPQDSSENPAISTSQSPVYSPQSGPVTPQTSNSQGTTPTQLTPKPQVASKPAMVVRSPPILPPARSAQRTSEQTPRWSPPIDQNVGSLVIPAVQQMPKLQSPPIPWMHQGSRSAQQDVAPPWVNREENDDANVRPSSTHIVPMQVEGRDNSQPTTPQTPGANKPGVRVVPIKIERSDRNTPPKQRTPEVTNQTPVGWGKNNSGTPTQSRAFRFLQQTTEGYDDIKPKTVVVPIEYEQPPSEQMRKLQLAEDDKLLMDQFKTHVDEEQYLHTEEEPRFRGAAIPSKAFRVLQCMTGTQADACQDEGPKGQTRPVKPPKPQGVDPTSPKPYIPPSEQKVLEPRKYTGCNIPGRSFKILQAITEPENYGPGQSDL